MFMNENFDTFYEVNLIMKYFGLYIFFGIFRTWKERICLLFLMKCILCKQVLFHRIYNNITIDNILLKK